MFVPKHAVGPKLEQKHQDPSPIPIVGPPPIKPFLICRAQLQGPSLFPLCSHPSQQLEKKGTCPAWCVSPGAAVAGDLGCSLPSFPPVLTLTLGPHSFQLPCGLGHRDDAECCWDFVGLLLVETAGVGDSERVRSGQGCPLLSVMGNLTFKTTLEMECDPGAMV